MNDCGVTELLALDSSESPTEFAALTLNVYPVPFVRPVQLAYVLETLQEAPAGEDATEYPVIADPPVLVGAVQATVADSLAAKALTEVGWPGGPSGTKSKSIQ